jgi:hypothetical protein
MPSPLKFVWANIIAVGGILWCNRSGIFLAKVIEDLPGGCKQLLAFRYAVVDLTQRQCTVAPNYLVRIVEAVNGPFGRGNDFRHTNPSVLVTINQRERLRVEL